MPILSSPVFAISGSPRVGKTSLAEEIAKRLGCSFASFGDYVRFVARSASNTSVPNRRTLQDLGQKLVASDPRGFCAAVLERASGNPTDPLVVDGLRHLGLMPILRELLPDRDLKLIFVESCSEMRIARWEGQPSEDEIAAIDSHPVEADLRSLRQRSDLIVDTTAGFDSAIKVLLDWMTEMYPTLARQAPIATGTVETSG